jgi:hypothetical protein
VKEQDNISHSIGKVTKTKKQPQKHKARKEVSQLKSQEKLNRASKDNCNHHWVKNGNSGGKKKQLCKKCRDQRFC